MSKLSELAMSWEWLPASGVRAPELSATWARLEISVGSETVTLVEDTESRSARRGIYVALYPLAEWIAFNWWALQANTRPASALAKLSSGSSIQSIQSYRRQHGIRSAGDGYIWPELYILPQGGTTRIIWRGDSQPFDGGPRFVSDGDTLVSPATLVQRLGDFVSNVVERLDEQGVRGTQLAEEWTNILGAEDEEAEYCRAAARLGLDPYSDDAKYEEEILKSGSLLDGELLGDFLDVVEPHEISSTLDWILAAKADIAALSSDVMSLSGIKRVPRPSRDWDRLPPWERGWAQARMVRKHMNLEPDTPARIERLVPSSVRQGPSHGLQAIGATVRDKGAGVVLARKLSLPTERFMLARSMWHVLWEDEDEFVITSAHTDRQRVERAFAAELLAPAEGIAAKLASMNDLRQADDPEFDEVAEHYGVGTLLVQHQVENQLLRGSFS